MIRKRFDLELKSPIAVGRIDDIFLLAERDDIISGNNNGLAQTHDVKNNLYSQAKNLQDFLSLGSFRNSDNDEYMQVKEVNANT